MATAEIMRRNAAVPLILLVVFMAGCSAVQVSQDYETGMSFWGLRSYAWVSQPNRGDGDIRENNPLLHKRFYHSINNKLAEMGYYLKDDPDFLVGYDFSVDTRLESEPYTTNLGFGVGRYYRYGGIGVVTSPDIHQYEVGIVVINFYDAETGDMVWRGKGTERFSPHSTPEKTTEWVNRVVESILAQFPPQ